MKYWNQKQFPDMPYPTDIDHPDSEFAVHGNVARAGCGLCSACMLAERLTLEHFSLEESRDLAMAAGANRKIGTDMLIFAPALAARLSLELSVTDDTEEMLHCLQNGGSAILHVGGDREGYSGIFSHGGHYMLGVSYDGSRVTVLDPAWTPEKYQEAVRTGKITEQGYWLTCLPELLTKETENRTPGYYLFRRKTAAR